MTGRKTSSSSGEMARPHQLTDDSYRDRALHWSPDGKRILFHSDRTGKWDVWMINADGSGLQMITYSSGTVTNAIWSPDGTRIAYRNPDYNTEIIEVGKPCRSSRHRHCPHERFRKFWVWSWSPDGQKLAGFPTENLGSHLRHSLLLFRFTTVCEAHRFRLISRLLE